MSRKKTAMLAACRMWTSWTPRPSGSSAQRRSSSCRRTHADRRWWWWWWCRGSASDDSLANCETTCCSRSDMSFTSTNSAWTATSAAPTPVSSRPVARKQPVFQTRASARFWLGGSVPPCRLRRRNFWKFGYEMMHSEVYLNKYVVSIAPFSTRAWPDYSQNIT